jgi:hypothetical protein
MSSGLSKASPAQDLLISLPSCRLATIHKEKGLFAGRSPRRGLKPFPPWRVLSRRTGGKAMNTPEIIRAANDVLTQGIELLLDLDNRSYSRAPSATFHTSVGKQYGAVLNHFVALVKGLSSGEVDYKRSSSQPRVESEVTFATIATCDILRALKRCSEQQLAGECEVTPASDSRIGSFTSTLSREIAYCVGNAIHHYSIIRVLCGDLGLSIPGTFGVTPREFRCHAAVAAD